MPSPQRQRSRHRGLVGGQGSGGDLMCCLLDVGKGGRPAGRLSTAESARSRSMPIAVSTGEGSVVPAWQADPVRGRQPGHGGEERIAGARR